MWFQATYSQCLYSGGLSDNPTIGFHLLKQAHVLGHLVKAGHRERGIMDFVFVILVAPLN
jgi:hypothetical protein